MTQNISILVNDLGASQLSYYLIGNLNQLAERPQVDPIVFYETLHRTCLIPKFAIMQLAEAWGQHGPIISTSLSTAAKMQDFPAKEKYFYVWDLEWQRGRQRQYEIFAPIYTDDSITLIARSESHKIAIENCFNRKVAHVIDNFNMNEMFEALTTNELERSK